MPGVLQAFAKGAGPFLDAVQEHDFLHATKLTLMLAAIAVPLNTLFGTVAAILITRNEFPGKVRSTGWVVKSHSLAWPGLAGMGAAPYLCKTAANKVCDRLWQHNTAPATD